MLDETMSAADRLQFLILGFRATRLIFVAAQLGLADMLADGPKTAELAVERSDNMPTRVMGDATLQLLHYHANMRRVKRKRACHSFDETDEFSPKEDDAQVLVHESMKRGRAQKSVVRDTERVIAATTSADPTVGLVFYDLKSCLRDAAEKPAPKRGKRKTDAS